MRINRAASLYRKCWFYWDFGKKRKANCDPHRAVVIGHDRNFCLRGGNMTSPDIRAGIALLIAALGAEGNSRIHNIEQIDRGYQNIEQRLTALGARITRIE